MKPNAEKWKGFARHWASVAGGVLLGLGYAQATDITDLMNHAEAVAGALAGVIAFVSSWYAREKQT